ncbi:MAG TPA: hypothetical protein VL242_47260 [Sorangium sp.]|nr:hypothetical protein [Sorangium sp.]
MPADPITAAALFERFFAPHYPPDALADLASARSTDANPAGNPSILAQIEHAAEVFARLAPGALGAPDLGLDFSDASVHRLGAALTRERRDAWLAPVVDARDARDARDAGGARGADSAPTTSGAGEPPMLVTLVTHGALYVGACVVKRHGGKW